MRYCYCWLIFALIFFQAAAEADQYRSRELAAPVDSVVAEKSVAELEQELSKISDEYSKASTARYLARHFSGEKDYQKAVAYYKEALQGEGLSDYAKQDVLAELAAVFLLQKNYRALVDTLKQREDLGGKQNARLLMMRAMAHYHLDAYPQAVAAADEAWAMKPRADANLLKQLLFVYYNSGSYANAAQAQKALLEKKPDDLSGWRQLSAIYLKMEKHADAADALQLARQQSLPLTEEDITRLAALYEKTGNPFAAARLFEQAMQEGSLAENLEHLDTLFRYWLLARERGKAIETLQQALAIKPDIERFLYLARLQMREEQWQAMKQSVTSACEIALPDEYVSRTNLLLGISELKLGNYAAARRAFINATLIGGEGEKASNWLRFMEAELPDEKEAAGFDGVCTPKWARTEARQLAIVTTDKPAAEQPQAVEYEIKTSEPKTLVVGSYTLPVVELEDKLLPLAMKLGTHVVKNRGRINGNMHFIFPEPIKPGDEVISFQMAFPVSREPQMLGRYRVRDDKGFKSASMLFEGAPDDLPGAWLQLYKAVTADGYEMADESRQIVIDPEKSDRQNIKLELQLGIKDKNE